MKSSRVFSFFFFAAFTAAAQTGTNTVMTQPMSLTDCIQQALQQNFDVQIQRYQPQISLYNLRAAYDGYDPAFNISGQHDYTVSPSRYSPYTVTNTPPSISDENQFNSGLTGELPLSGLQYTFSGNIAEAYGNNGLPFDNSFGSIGVTLQQPLLKNFWIDSTRLTIRLAKNQLKNDEQGVRQQLITSVTAVVNAYFELIFAQQNVQVQQQALDLAQTQLD